MKLLAPLFLLAVLGGSVTLAVVLWPRAEVLCVYEYSNAFEHVMHAMLEGEWWSPEVRPRMLLRFEKGTGLLHTQEGDNSIQVTTMHLVGASLAGDVVLQCENGNTEFRAVLQRHRDVMVFTIVPAGRKVWPTVPFELRRVRPEDEDSPALAALRAGAPPPRPAPARCRSRSWGAASR